ncbi:outer membrane protein assembly factor BamB family protein [Paractinoplanes abujensis]|uniref:Outer membrane protein assembly factor BamB n=1 Tax=Paractinoplanes abujensis TaxID=882441 RepID=A0A7W7CX66_9ACTN|nr:PQQ-binding-like beta-propeller repeat protein [Actinoplanes abujensis]MBB4696297.1 outer membrane protein assembly factor BamB [Actinoplanes abujensis]
MRPFAAALLVALLIPAPAVAANPGWEHPGYDAEDSFYNPNESKINASTVGTLTRRWSVALRRQEEPSCSGPSAPVVAGGSVLATDEKGISSYSALTGRLTWSFDWTDPGDSHTPSIAVSDGVVVLGSGGCNSASDPDGRLVALDLTSGRVKWRHELDPPVGSFVVDRGMIVVSGESSSDEAVTVGYRAADGRAMWQKPGYESSSVSSAGRILVTKGRSTSAISVTTGAVIWTQPVSLYAESATPTRFLVTDAATLRLVDAATGALLWVATGQQSKLLATDGRRIYRAANRTVSALDLRDGRTIWTRTLPVPASQPVRAGGLLYTGNAVLSAASGAVVKRHDGASVVIGGHLYSVADGRLAAYAPRP